MSPITEVQLAEAADRRWELLAVAIFLMGVKAAASAAMVVVEQPWLRYLDWLEATAALAAVGIVAWMVFFKLTRVPRELRHRYLNFEGFVGDMIKESMKVSWLATFVLLTFMSFFSDRWFAEVPTEFFLQLAVAVMLGVFSVAFFVKNRADVEDEVPAGA